MGITPTKPHEEISVIVNTAGKQPFNQSTQSSFSVQSKQFHANSKAKTNNNNDLNDTFDSHH
jgi:hypothetical protein